MKQHEPSLHEINRHERWLANLLAAEALPSTEHLKLRLRVAMGEQWLTRKLGEAPDSISESVRDRVRLGLTSRESRTAQSDSREAPTWRTLAGIALGLAAMLFLSLSVFRSDNAEVADADLAVVTAFEEATTQDEDESNSGDLVEIDDELAELSALMASLYESESDDIFEGL